MLVWSPLYIVSQVTIQATWASWLSPFCELLVPVKALEVVSHLIVAHRLVAVVPMVLELGTSKYIIILLMTSQATRTIANPTILALKQFLAVVIIVSDPEDSIYISPAMTMPTIATMTTIFSPHLTRFWKPCIRWQIVQGEVFPQGTMLEQEPEEVAGVVVAGVWAIAILKLKKKRIMKNDEMRYFVFFIFFKSLTKRQGC
jgi:hypothetical protein